MKSKISTVVEENVGHYLDHSRGEGLLKNMKAPSHKWNTHIFDYIKLKFSVVWFPVNYGQS